MTATTMQAVIAEMQSAADRQLDKIVAERLKGDTAEYVKGTVEGWATAVCIAKAQEDKLPSEILPGLRAGLQVAEQALKVEYAKGKNTRTLGQYMTMTAGMRKVLAWAEQA